MATLSSTARARSRPTRRAGTEGPRDVASAPNAGLFGLVTLVALVVVLATQYSGALRIPFINDDFVFLDKVRGASTLELVGFDRLTFGWYRPWSRELHYAFWSRVAGEREMPFHVASLALWVLVLLGYALLVRHMAGARVAAIAVAGAAALSAWAVPVLWVAGVQELWMLLWAVLALHAFARGLGGLAAVALALSLLSKETAAVLPGVMLAQARWVDRESWGGAVRRVMPCLVVLLAWVCVHPRAGGRLWQHAPESAAVAAAAIGDGATTPAPAERAAASRTAAERAARTVLALANLDQTPRPDSGWVNAVRLAWPATLALALLVGWVALRTGTPRAGRSSLGGVAMFGVAWTLLGWIPLALPGLGWHGYYGLLGMLGAWLVLGVAFARAPAAAMAVVVASTVLRAAAADTPSRDWGAEWYQRRAGAFLDYMRRDLARLHPSLPPHSRLFFLSVPSNVGFLTETGPSLRIWYRDSTLWGGYFSQYVKRPESRPGEDFFFRYDSTAGWREIQAGPENVADAMQASPTWTGDTRELATAFARAEDWARAASQYEKLARAEPEAADAALDAGVSHAMARDTTAALGWFRIAADRPQATLEQQDQARAYARELGAKPDPPQPIPKRGSGRRRSGR